MVNGHEALSAAEVMIAHVRDGLRRRPLAFHDAESEIQRLAFEVQHTGDGKALYWVLPLLKRILDELRDRRAQP